VSAPFLASSNRHGCLKRYRRKVLRSAVDRPSSPLRRDERASTARAHQTAAAHSSGQIASRGHAEPWRVTTIIPPSVGFLSTRSVSGESAAAQLRAEPGASTMSKRARVQLRPAKSRLSGVTVPGGWRANSRMSDGRTPKTESLSSKGSPSTKI
jgi:hypothetical protein